MKIPHLSIIVMIGMIIVVSPFNNTLAQNMTNSSNPISPISSAILHSPVPTLSPSENQSVVNVALSISELQNWSHDWQYVTMGFGGNNKVAPGDFEWQYASVVLKAPSSSAPFTCNNDWWAWVDVDMTTMKVVKATYPTMKSHSCQVVMGGGPGTLGAKSSNSTTGIESPLQQFRSGIAANDVKCNSGFQFIIKAENGSPTCVKQDTIIPLTLRGWTSGSPNSEIVYFMKSNSVAQIFVKFTSNRVEGFGPAQPIPLNPRFYALGANPGYPTGAINATVTPDSVQLGSTTMVTYTITSQGTPSGIYWLSVSGPCDSIPVVVNLELSQITSSDLQSPTASWKCSSPLLRYQIVGVSGITIGLVSVESLKP